VILLVVVQFNSYPLSEVDFFRAHDYFILEYLVCTYRKLKAPQSDVSVLLTCGRREGGKMNLGEQFRDFTGPQASKMIVELLRAVSDERLVQLTYLGQQLTADHEFLDVIRGVRNLLQTPGHPARNLFRGILEYLPAKNRTLIFNTLFNNAWFQGKKKRDQFEKELQIQ